MQEIKNPGFEEGTPNNWQTYNTGTVQRYTYPEPGRVVGSSAVAIEHPTRDMGKVSMWVQNIQIDRTKKYKLSGWLKTQNIIGTGVSIRVDWKDATGKYLGTSAIMPYQKGTIPWTYFEGIVTPDQRSVGTTIVLDLYDCSGKVWFDDLSFSDVVPVIKYKCNNGECVQDSNGQYDSIAECESVLKYACIDGSCVKVCPDYIGTKYNTLAECQATCGSIPPDYHLVFEDNFNTFDESKWFRTWWGEQCPGNYFRCDHVSVSNNNLVIHADHDSSGYHTGIIRSKQMLGPYGILEIRAKYADGNGKPNINNQIWLSSDGWTFEVDAASNSSADPDMVQSTMMYQDPSCPYYPDRKRNQCWDGGMRKTFPFNIVGQWHVYKFEWTLDYAKFSVDGIEIYTQKQARFVPNVKMGIHIALCIGKCDFPWLYNPAANPTPTDLLIDYVRFYQKN